MNFLENAKKQTWNSFNTKFQNQWKDSKTNCQVRYILVFARLIIALIFGWNSVKILRDTKSVKENKFIWEKLEPTKCFRKQKLTNYLGLALVSMWNSTQWEKFTFYFSRIFSSINKSLILERGLHTCLSFN